MDGIDDQRPQCGIQDFCRRAIPWAVALGVLLRLYHYGRNPAMWHDEAATCINIIQRSFAGLFGHLEHSATGPSLLLCIQKCLTFVLGDGTYSLRLVSVVTACAGLALFARLSKKMLEPASALFVTIFVACSDRMLWHASEARHYSTDFLIATVMLMLFVNGAGKPLTRRLACFAVFVPFAILFCYPGVFLFAGLMAALLPEVRNDKTGRVGWCLLGLWVGAVFALFYFTTIRGQRSGAMDNAWVNVMPDIHKPWKLPWWFCASTLDIFDYLARPLAGGILVGPAIAGGVALWKENKKPLLALILIPIGLAALAALAKSYPYTGARTMVYAMPGLGILIGKGFLPLIGWLNVRLPRIPARIVAIILCMPIAGELVFSLYGVVRPWPRADTAGASKYVLEHRLDSEPVTANHWEYEYYFRNLGGEFTPDLGFFNSPAAEHTSRVWVVLTSGKQAQRMDLVNGITGHGWKMIEEHDFENTGVFLLSRVPQK